MRLLVALVFACSFAGVAYAQTTDQGPTNESQRRLCYTVVQQQCNMLPFEEAVKQNSLPLPPAVEAAFEKGYLPFESVVQTTGGINEVSRCGSFIVNREERLGIASLHCGPEYVDQLNNSRMTALGVPAKFVAKLPFSDLMLFQLERIPEGKDAVPFVEPVVQEPIYGKSLQQTRIANPEGTKNISEALYFRGLVSFTGIVVAKGELRVNQYNSATLTQEPSANVVPTPYEIMRISISIEPGYSGAPVFNQWGQVVGILTAGGTINYSVTAKNFPALLALYQKRP